MKNVPIPMKVPTLSDDDSAHRVRPVSAVGAAPDASSQSVWSGFAIRTMSWILRLLFRRPQRHNFPVCLSRRCNNICILMGIRARHSKPFRLMMF